MIEDPKEIVIAIKNLKKGDGISDLIDQTKWSDDKILEQVEVFLSQAKLTERAVKDKIETIILNFDLSKSATEIIEDAKNQLYNFLNWTNEKFLDRNFWSQFYYCRDISCQVIFGNTWDSENYMVAGIIANFLSDEAPLIIERYKKNLVQFEPSSFNTLKELEDGVIYSKIPEEAKKFYKDKSKNFQERVKAFSKHAIRSSYINPVHPILNRIFEYDFQNNHSDEERNDYILSEDIINNWIDMLKTHRCTFVKEKFDSYKIKKSHRKFTPSKKALEKLFHLYMEKLIFEDFSGVDFDW
jgi:hypothetical protein